MNVHRIIVVFVAATALGLLALPARAQSQSLADEKIAIVNPARVFSQIQETKDLQQKFSANQQKLQGDAKDREQKVKDLQAQRDLLKSDSPQYAKANDDFMRAAIDFDTWSKITQAQLQGQQKQQMKTLFDKIVQATQEVAQQRGIDLVIADQRTELPENLVQINVEQLREMLNSRNVLYADQKVDLTQDVIATMDAKYRASGGGGATTGASSAEPPPAAPAAPAPAGH